MDLPVKDAIDVITPLEQEGTKAVVKAWYKKVGDTIAVNEALVELETDKVAVEVSAPDAGVLLEILIAPGDEAVPGQVLGRIGAAAVEAKSTMVAAPAAPVAAADSHNAELPAQAEERWSPSVRRLITESGVDVSGVTGSGRDGRLTREDVVAAIELRATIPAATTPARPAATAVRAAPVAISAGRDTKIPHDNMRRRIAEHMSHSLSVAPHVTAVFEADFSAIMAHRKAHKAEFERQGANLTFTAYIVAACVEAMKLVPTVNSQWHDDYLQVFGDVNIGVGTALGDKGLIVPVVHKAHGLSLLGIATRLTEMTDRARTGKLSAGDVQNGTFTISNHGVSGSLVATPIIINQPQNAILGVGKLEKRVVVREVGGQDAILIRPMAYVSLSIDHRALDGAQTNAWLTRFVETLETWPL